MATNLYLIAAAVMLACAPAPSGSGGGPAPRRATVLTAAEILAAGGDGGTVYDAIVRFRPSWLAHRTESYDPPSTDLPVAFVDGQRYGTPESLRSINSDQIADVRFYSPAEASKFGLQGGLSGVIEVSMKKK